MGHYGRLIGGNKGTETPSNLIFVDTETRWKVRKGQRLKKDHTLRLWCAVRVRMEGDRVTRRKEAWGEDWKDFWSFVDECSDKFRSTWVFAHNLGFDLTQLHFWDMLDNGHFTLRRTFRDGDDRPESRKKTFTGRLCLNSLPTYIVVTHGEKSVRFVDSANYWPSRLSDIGKSLGKSKRKMPGLEADTEVWRDYCRRDVEILEGAVTNLLRFWRRENCGVFQLTGPALALTNWKHICDVRTPDGKSPDVVCDPGAKQHEMERESYFGGRTQCYYVGEVTGKIFHFDCNSLYPYVMRECEYPRRFGGYSYDVSTVDVRRREGGYLCIARVGINSDGQTFPVRIDKQQYHCYGKFCTTLCGPELSRALDNNCVDRIFALQWYSAGRIFRKWVDYWYDRKRTAQAAGPGHAGELEFIKLILNSLSGKWAQRGRNWKDRPDRIPRFRWGAWPEYNADTGQWQNWRGVGGNAQVQTEEEEPPHSFPAISAFITANAREYMRRVIGLLPDESIYYSATDSIICDQKGADALQSNGLIDQTALGLFKLCGEYSRCKIHGPNHYELDGKRIATGLLGKLYAKDLAKGYADVWERMPAFISSGPRSHVTVTRVFVRPPKLNQKGIIDSNGRWNPYCLEDSEDWRVGSLVASGLRGYSLDSLADRIVTPFELS